MDNFSAYLLGLLAMMAIEWPFSLLPLLIIAHLRQTNEEMRWRKKTNTSTFERPFEKKKTYKCHRTAEQPKPQSQTHKNSNSKQQQQQRSTTTPPPLAPTILSLYSLIHFPIASEKKKKLLNQIVRIFNAICTCSDIYPSLQHFLTAFRSLPLQRSVAWPPVRPPARFARWNPPNEKNIYLYVKIVIFHALFRHFTR